MVPELPMNDPVLDDFASHNLPDVTIIHADPDGKIVVIGDPSTPIKAGDYVTVSTFSIHTGHTVNVGFLRTWDVDIDGNPVQVNRDVHYRVIDTADDGTVWLLQHDPRVVTHPIRRVIDGDDV